MFYYPYSTLCLCFQTALATGLQDAPSDQVQDQMEAKEFKALFLTSYVPDALIGKLVCDKYLAPWEIVCQ